ncbi:MAG: MBL fold metallo-hydrolase [Clostridia bacterium]|nr:MBL fold metallo-hydrolase [Clostridia bacterium]
MKILWLGQGGLLFVSGKTKIMIDPYLSDSLSKENHEFARRMRLNKKLFRVKPDALIITNSHSDHADIETIERISKHRKNRKKLTVLSCKSVFDELVNIPTVCQANHIMLEAGSEWTIDNINICAVPAKTDDKSAFGVIITDFEDNKKYYVTGDTLYNKYVIQQIPNDIYATFLPINGEYGSMNLTDAKRFAKAINSNFYVPVHFGMFDKINPKLFDIDNSIIPSAYKIINFDLSDNQPYKKGLDFRFNEKQEKSDSKTKIVDEVAENTSTPVVIYEDTGDEKDTGNDLPVIIANKISEESISEESDDIPYEDAIMKSAEDVSINENDALEENEESDDEIYEDDDLLEDDEEFEDELFDDEENEGEDIPFEEGDWSEFLDNDAENDDLDELIDDEEEDIEDEKPSYIHSTESDDDSDKIDAYIREIEKFERGETTDFSKID